MRLTDARLVTPCSCHCSMQRWGPSRQAYVGALPGLLSTPRTASHSLASTSGPPIVACTGTERVERPIGPAFDSSIGRRHPPSGSDNGQGWNAATTAAAQRAVESSAEQLADLQRSMKQIQGLVRSQQRQILEQQEALAHLSGLVQPQPLQPANSASLGLARAASARAPLRPFEAQLAAHTDRRGIGMYDARFHSTNWGATPRDHRILPKRIILVRHAESEGNVDNFAYTYVPDPQVPLTQRGLWQAEEAGRKIKAMMAADGAPFRLYFYMSPYRRSSQTTYSIASQFREEEVAGFQEEVQLREQDFGNFQDAEGKQREKAERLRFGRFFYRFPNGESGADVYDRMTIFEDHMIRDINAGRYAKNTSLVLVTHGLAARIFLMRWFHWSVDQFMSVYNPPNAEPIVLERITGRGGKGSAPASWIHTKALFKLTPESKDIIRGCTDEMCSTSALLSGLKVSDWIAED